MGKHLPNGQGTRRAPARHPKGTHTAPEGHPKGTHKAPEGPPHGTYKAPADTRMTLRRGQTKGANEGDKRRGQTRETNEGDLDKFTFPGALVKVHLPWVFFGCLSGVFRVPRGCFAGAIRVL